MGVHLFAISECAEPRADLQDAREGVLVGRDGAGEHAEEEAEGFLRGVAPDEGADEDIVSLGVRAGDRAEDLEGVIEAAGEEEGGALEEVLGDGGEAGGAGLDEAGVDLVQVAESPALFQDDGLVVGSRGGLREGRGGLGREDGGCEGHHVCSRAIQNTIVRYIYWKFHIIILLLFENSDF